MDAIEWHEELARHSKKAEKAGWCEQCRKPWNDGICDCGHGDDPEVVAALELAFSVELVPKKRVSP